MIDIKKLTSRKLTAHKGDSGRVLVIGGSKTYVGAGALAGNAALRAGSDVLTKAIFLFTPATSRRGYST